jgi:hypothetical protein
MEMEINVLWIDDEYKTQIDFIGQAEQEGINIFPFESHDEGINELTYKMDFYHAVILDAKVKKKKDDTVTGLEGLRASRDRLIEINKEVFLPFFIFTGQPDYCSSDMFRESFGKYYIKAKDNELLFLDIIKAVDQKIEYQLQKKYQRIFELCDDKYLGKEASSILLESIKLTENNSEFKYTKDDLNALRKIVELLFRKLNNIGLIPDEIYKSNNWMNPSSLFLSGFHKTYKIKDDIIHPTVTFLLKNIVQVTQDASHVVTERLNHKIDQFIEENQTSYLYQSILFQLFDVLIWFKKFIDNNPDIEINKTFSYAYNPQSELNPGDWIKGKIIRIAENGWGTFEPYNNGKTISIPPIIITQNNLSENDCIEITTKPDVSGTKTYIDKLIKT